MKRVKKLKDERIEKESNAFFAKLYPWQLGLLIILFIFKLVKHAPFRMCMLDVITLVTSIGFIIIGLQVRGLLCTKTKDEQMIMNRNKILMIGYAILFSFLVFGEVILMLLFPDDLNYIFLYFMICFIPALIATIVMLKKGWLVWGTKKRKVEGLNSFRKRVIIGSFFFGIVAGKDFIYSDGAFHVTGIFWALGMGALWGVLFYITMKAFINKSEKNADKLVQQSDEDKSHEE